MTEVKRKFSPTGIHFKREDSGKSKIEEDENLLLVGIVTRKDSQTYHLNRDYLMMVKEDPSLIDIFLERGDTLREEFDQGPPRPVSSPAYYIIAKIPYEGCKK